MVLPRPGAPSSNTWPPASSAISTPSTTSAWPTMALEISPRTSCIFSARDSACCPSGLSPFCPSIRTDPVMNPSDPGQPYASFKQFSVKCRARTLLPEIQFSPDTKIISVHCRGARNNAEYTSGSVPEYFPAPLHLSPPRLGATHREPVTAPYPSHD